MKTILLLIFIYFFGTTFTATVKNSNAAAAGNKWMTLDGNPTLLMGHRGEKVFMPEHTVGSYELASIEGAEFVEPDLTLTKDGELVCYHDLTLKSGTNIEHIPEFADRMRNFTGWLEGNLVNYTNDWFIQNFTVQELRALKVQQPDKGIRPQYFNELFYVPTFKEYLNVVHKMAYKMKKPIGIIPELKHPIFNNEPWGGSYYMETKLLNTLREYGYPIKQNDQPNCKYENMNITCGELIIQSFDQYCIQYLKTVTNQNLMMLNDDNVQLLTYEGLKNVSKFASYYGIWKEYLYSGSEAVLLQKGKDYNPNDIKTWGGFISKDTFVDDAHKLGLKMSIYTIYDSHEQSYRGCDIKCNPENKTEELFYYFNMGLDGIFVENIMEAKELRMKFEYEILHKNNNDNQNSAKLYIGNQYFIIFIFNVIVVSLNFVEWLL